MFTIIEIHTGESVKDGTEPVLFDTIEEAADFAAAQGLGREFAIVDTDEVI